MRFKAVILLAVVFVTAGVVAGGDAKGDLKRFQGTWSITSAVEGGKAAPEEMIKDFRVVIEGNKMTVTMGDKSMEGTFKIDPDKKPKQIDVMFKEKKKGGKGIYRFKKGGMLEVCAAEEGEERPTEFKSAEGSKTALFLLKREKK
jgi:uncharacterized protein (TIGR03067 family)